MKLVRFVLFAKKKCMFQLCFDVNMSSVKNAYQNGDNTSLLCFYLYMTKENRFYMLYNFDV